MVLEEDPLSHEKRYLELRKNSRMEKAAKSLSQISLEVDRLGVQVSGLESVVSKGGKVVEKDLVNLIELLMNQLLKLDGVVADGEVKLQRKMQVRRVQKYVETLDILKIKNVMDEPKQRQPSPKPASVVVTTQWETFDSITVSDGAPSMSTDSSHPTPPTYTWDLL